MNEKLYRIAEFSKLASVSPRTLRYYDEKGLLKPSNYNHTGYRMYTKDDLWKLQYILSLKFLGFSLSDIKNLLDSENGNFKNSIKKQKEMMIEQKIKMESIIFAPSEVEDLIEKNIYDDDALIEAIKGVQMELKPIWMNKYLSRDEREYVREVAREVYDKESLKKLSEIGWTEEDQDRYIKFRSELKRLSNLEVSFDSEEAKGLVQMVINLNNKGIMADEKLKAGIKKYWEIYNAHDDKRKSEFYKISDKERVFLRNIMKAFYKNSN